MGSEEELLVIEARETALGGGWSIFDLARLNITNYRSIIIDATELFVLLLNERTAENAVRQFGPIRSAVSDVLRAGGQVVILLPSPEQSESTSLTNVLPGPLSYTYDRKLMVALTTQSLADYFRAIKTVDGRMESGNPNLETDTLAWGKLGQKLAIKTKIDSGSITYLPPYRGPASDAIDVVARDVLDTPRGVTWPEWVSSAPFQPVQAAYEAFEKAKQELARAENRVLETLQQYEAVREPLGVLIETGLKLQKRCEELFQGIGIRTSLVRTDVSDEFMLEGGPKPILVEVKGLEGSAKKSHLNQLLTDAAHWEERENGEAVPLLLVNAYRSLPLADREHGGNQPFSQWVIEKAPRLGAVLMATWDLLELYYAGQSGSNIGQRLLEVICQSTGRPDVKKLLRGSPAAN